MQIRRRLRGGSALVTVLALTGVITVVVGATLSYMSSATRMTVAAAGRDICRLAAQSEIELAKSAIYYRFMLSLNRSARIIGGDTVGAQSASSFDWFEAYSGATPKNTIGAKNTITFADSVTVPGGAADVEVKVRVARVEHVVGTQWADVTLVAEATRQNPGGTVSKSVVAEKMRFAQQRSAVFNNAYFVNNYGWFQGTGCTANGDVRSNGDMYLDANCKVNGNVHAARNEELGVDGDVTNYGKMDDETTYKSTTYGVSNAARPLYTDPTTGTVNPGGFEAPSRVTTQHLKNRVHANEALSVEMPYIGDISSSESDYRAWAQELHDKDSSMATIKQGGKTIASVFYDGAGPSGLQYATDMGGNPITDANGNNVPAADYGALVLEGTQSNPIEINGPVIVPNDVIIKGYVRGQGTIYSGRNIHIVGNIQYVNPPRWSNKSSANSSNSTKDMLGLMAKGNIVLGDYSKSGWLSDKMRKYLTTSPYVQQYACDTSDAAIGYPGTFGGSYIATEYVSSAEFNNCSQAGLTDYVPGGYDPSSGKFGKLRTTYSAGERKKAAASGYYDTWNSMKGTKESKWLSKGASYTECLERTGTSFGRKYYESTCDDSEISSRYSSDITRVDAILYNNHGIFGHIGNCTFNGSLVCRNESLLYDSSLYLNWDIRLYSGSNESVGNDKVGLAKSSDARPQTLLWMELPEGIVSFD